MSDHRSDADKDGLRHSVGGLDFTWDPAQGLTSIGTFPTVTLFRDTSLASLMAGFHAMVGPERFALALQVEGGRGTDGDWAVISAAPTFEEGFAALANFAATAGWGRWRLVSVDRDAREMRLEITEGFEAHIQKALGIRWGAGLVGGKFADFGTRLFGTHCRVELLVAMADGAPADVFRVRPSPTSLADELEALLTTEKATRADLANALKELKQLSSERERAFDEREQMVTELREQLRLIETQQQAISAMSTPIIQVWDGVLVVPVIGTVDGTRTAEIMEKLLEAVVRTRSRHAILDLTGVESLDARTAENFLRVVEAAQLVGARGALAGISPQVAQTIVNLGVSLGGIASYSNLKEALKAAIRTMSEG